MPQVFSSVKEAVACVKRRASCSVLLTGDNHKHSTAKEETITTTITLLDTHEEEEVDISQYTEDDLERLRLEDPFLYYSIPQVKRSLFNSHSKTSSTRRSSCPTILAVDDDDESQQQQRRGSVTRARRLSTEPHPSLFIQDLIKDMDEEFDESDIDEEDEELIQALANGTFDMED
mmetsp:Transcript_18734/g.30691  ORF Transcript_18734/g.30691 Transcript_18734/m.30691 type:complete len:175 (+) Transcript_18734:136-660(+)